MNVLQKAWGHLTTITRHRHRVIANCFRAGIPWQGLLHDLSKYSPTELVPGIKYYQGTRSPNEAEREHDGFSQAWVHHKGRNRHHFEYWTDYNAVTHIMEPVPMPYLCVVEMFCDRVAAGQTYLKDKFTQGSPLAYYEKGRSHRKIHPKTAAQIEFLLKMLAERGEDETFRYIRQQVKRYRRRKN